MGSDKSTLLANQRLIFMSKKNHFKPMESNHATRETSFWNIWSKTAWLLFSQFIINVTKCTYTRVGFIYRNSSLRSRPFIK